MKKNRRRLFLILIDVLIFLAVSVTSMVLSDIANNSIFDFSREAFEYNLAVFCVILIVRLSFGAYSNVWRYANSGAYLQMIFCDFSGTAIALAFIICFGNYNSSFWKILSVASTFNIIKKK